MIIRHKRHARDFIQVHKLAAEDPNLSFKAKGIHTYIMSKPDHWVIRLADLCNHSSDGEESVRSGLKNLEKHGYAKLIRGGKDGGGQWLIFETPSLNADIAETATSSDMAETRSSGNPKFGFYDPSKNNVLSNNQGASKNKKNMPFTSFVDGWFSIFRQTFGVKYVMNGVDGKAVKALIKSGMTVSELLALAESAWAMTGKDQWIKDTCLTIAGFKSQLNRVQVKQSTAGSSDLLIPPPEHRHPAAA